MRIGACQTPELLGDVAGAVDTIESFAAGAVDADLLLFPECLLPGYLVTPEHLAGYGLRLDGPEFGAIRARLASIRATLVFGVIERVGDAYFNSAVVLTGGEVEGVYRKTHLTRGERTFTAGSDYPVFERDGVRFGINICYDTQFTEAARAVAEQGADVLLVLSQNMMPRAKAEFWQPLHGAIRAERARATELWLVSADVTGVRGDRIGLGPTSVIGPDGSLDAQVPAGAVGLVTVDLTGSRRPPASR